MRLADGGVLTGALPPARHRALPLEMLHAETRELAPKLRTDAGLK